MDGALRGDDNKMEKKDLKKISAREGIPQAMVEKDYALSVALAQIASSTLSDKLVFKGGTSIRKIYFEKARFSEDLDFNVKSGINKQSILSEFRKTFSNIE